MGAILVIFGPRIWLHSARVPGAMRLTDLFEEEMSGKDGIEIGTQ